MSTFTPSRFQLPVFDFIKTGKGNAVINAVAGSGKTTTIVKALELIPTDQEIIFLAFNKAIVEEISRKVPQGVKVQTLHGLGFGAIMKYTNRKAKMNEYVVQNIIKVKLTEEWEIEDDAYGYGQRVRKLVDLLRINLVKTQAELEDLAQKHDIEVVNGECGKAFEVMQAKKMFPYEFDYVDMLYMPASNDKMVLPKYDFVFVDECQDLNKAQQVLISKIRKPSGRFVAVGDPRQAIYGFAGADIESFTNLVNTPNTVQLPLSVNYRCPKAVIRFVNEQFPNIPIEAHDNAPEGVLDFEAKFESIQDKDYVLCRNVAPLVQMCLEFIARQQKAYVKGGDIGKSLINLIKKSGKSYVTDLMSYMQKDLQKIYDKLRKNLPSLDDEDLRQMPSYRLYKEKITVMETISDACAITQCYALQQKIEEIFADDKEGICFSSIHKSKGLEADNIFIIEKELMPSKYAKKAWQMEQETNLMYVAYTRAKQSLNFVANWSYKRKHE